MEPRETPPAGCITCVCAAEQTVSAEVYQSSQQLVARAVRAYACAMSALGRGASEENLLRDFIQLDIYVSNGD